MQPEGPEAEEVAPRPGEEAVPQRGSSAHLVAVGILASRVFGLLRDRYIGRYFGLSEYAGVFRAALRMPNMLQNLLGEGTLSASFIPVYARLLEEGKEEEAGRVAGAVFSLLLAIAGALSLIGTLAAPLLVTFFLKGFTGEVRDLTIACTRIIFPMTGVLVLSAWTLGILNAHRRFLLPYIAPVLWNAAMIATLVLLGRGMSLDRLVVALAWGAFVGGVLQFAVQVPMVLRLERHLRLGGWNEPGLRTVVKNAAPAIAGRGVVQLSGWLDMFLASFLGAVAIAALSNAQTLFMLPVSLFGMSVAASELPELSRQKEAAVEVLKSRIGRALTQISLLTVPSAVGYLLLGNVVVGAIYQTGRFSAADTRYVWLVLAGYSIGLFASTTTRLFSSAFFALRDTRTPARIAILRVAVSGLLGAAVTGWAVLVNRDLLHLAPVGLALAGSIGAWIEWLLLRRGLVGRLGGLGVPHAVLPKMFAAALAAAAIGFGIAYVVPDLHPIIRAVVVLGPFGIAYFILARLFGVSEAGELMDRVLRRVRR